MEIDAKIEDVKTVTLHVRMKKGGKHGSITLPQDIIKRYDLQDKSEIVIAFIKRVDV